MVIFLLILLFLINIIPFIKYTYEYKHLRSEDDVVYQPLLKKMRKVDLITIPLSIVIIITIYLIY